MAKAAEFIEEKLPEGGTVLRVSGPMVIASINDLDTAVVMAKIQAAAGYSRHRIALFFVVWSKAKRLNLFFCFFFVFVLWLMLLVSAPIMAAATLSLAMTLTVAVAERRSNPKT